MNGLVNVLRMVQEVRNRVHLYENKCKTTLRVNLIKRQNRELTKLKKIFKFKVKRKRIVKV